MNSQSRRPLANYLRPFLFLLTLNFILPAQALYFYFDGASKCFYEELPKDTLVVGEH